MKGDYVCIFNLTEKNCTYYPEFRATCPSNCPNSILSVKKDLIKKFTNLVDSANDLEIEKIKKFIEDFTNEKEIKMSERKIGIQLRNIVKNDDACESLGLNPWCVNEGADGDKLIEVNYDDAKKWSLI
jgi:hypothetical protein